MAGIWLPIYECTSCGGDVFGGDEKCTKCIRAEDEDGWYKEHQKRVAEEKNCKCNGCDKDNKEPLALRMVAHNKYMGWC